MKWKYQTDDIEKSEGVHFTLSPIVFGETMENIGGILGLRVESLSQASKSSHLSPARITLSEVRSMNIVFHGHARPFGYEYFGIHRGTEDRLTFIGHPDKAIHAYFIDCRENSPSWGIRFNTQFNPNISEVLVIPPGVAHTFDGIEDIYTLNSFKNFLPNPDDWISGDNEWGLTADTINFARDTQDVELPRVKFNHLDASDYFYELTSRNLSLQQMDLVQEYPLTKRFNFNDGTSKLLKIRKPPTRAINVPRIEEIPGIDGLYWGRRAFVTGSDDFESGFTTFIGPNKLTVFEPGSDTSIIKSSDLSSPGGHRITFFGPANAEIEISLSNGKHAFRFCTAPSPFRELVLPVGVDFELRNLGGVITAVKHSSN